MGGVHDDFEALAKSLEGVPFMTPRQGRLVYDHLRENGAVSVLDVGTCYGVSAAYLAAAVKANGGGKVVTVDSSQFDAESQAADWARQVWERCEVTDIVESIRIDHTSYAWWLLERVRERTPEAGSCEPEFDFAYLDGAKNLAIDGVSAVLIEQLLRPGGWLLLDDVEWRYGDDRTFELEFDGFRLTPSRAERESPHIRAVVEHVLAAHPSFVEARIEGSWAWLRRTTDPQSRTPPTEASPPPGHRRPVPALLRRARRRLRRARGPRA